MSAHQAIFPIAAMARVLSVSRAGYYAWLEREPSARARADEALLRRIRTVHAISRGTYGAPRISAELKADKDLVGRKRVARLMREAALAGISRRRCRCRRPCRFMVPSTRLWFGGCRLSAKARRRMIACTRR